MFFVENKLKQIVFFFPRSNVMYWTSEHDVLLCREVVSENPYKTRKGSSERSEMWDKIARTLNACPKPIFAVDKRSVRDHVGILINRIKKKKWRAEERSSGIAPPEPTELEILVEEIVALEETADAEMKEDDVEIVKGKAEKEKAKATDMRLRALEKVSETMERHSGENDQEKVKKRERRSGSETTLFLSKKAEKDQELKLEELKLKKEQHDLDAKRLQASMTSNASFSNSKVKNDAADARTTTTAAAATLGITATDVKAATRPN